MTQIKWYLILAIVILCVDHKQSTNPAVVAKEEQAVLWTGQSTGYIRTTKEVSRISNYTFESNDILIDGIDNFVYRSTGVTVWADSITIGDCTDIIVEAEGNPSYSIIDQHNKFYYYSNGNWKTQNLK